MKVKLNDIGGNSLDTIQFAHRHNKKNPQPFSIEIDVAKDREPTVYFTTKSFEIMDAISNEWPNATIITTK